MRKRLIKGGVIGVSSEAETLIRGGVIGVSSEAET